jgi:hypothetical protein
MYHLSFNVSSIFAPLPLRAIALNLLFLIYLFRIPVAILSRVCRHHNPLGSSKSLPYSRRAGGCSQAYRRRNSSLRQPFVAFLPSISAT